MATDLTQIEEFKITIRIQQKGYDREVLIPRSRYIVESLDADNIGNVEEYTLNVTPEYFSYIKSSSNKMIVLDRTKMTEEEAEKIKKEIGMYPEESEPKADTVLDTKHYLPRQECIVAYHAFTNNLADVAKALRGTVDYSNVLEPVIKFKANKKSSRKDRELRSGETAYVDRNLGENAKWEVIETWQFARLYRPASEDEILP